MESGPNDESIGDCFEVAAVIMVSKVEIKTLWNLIELTRFLTDCDGIEGTQEMTHQHVADNLAEVRKWRPVTVDMPNRQP